MQGGHLHRLRLFSGDRIVRVTGRAGLGPGAGGCLVITSTFSLSAFLPSLQFNYMYLKVWTS